MTGAGYWYLQCTDQHNPVQPISQMLPAFGTFCTNIYKKKSLNVCFIDTAAEAVLCGVVKLNVVYLMEF